VDQEASLDALHYPAARRCRSLLRGSIPSRVVNVRCAASPSSLMRRLTVVSRTTAMSTCYLPTRRSRPT
jgi:hypothetical protein